MNRPQASPPSSSRHENEVAALYATLSLLEHKTDWLRAELNSRADRIEARLALDPVGSTTPETEPPGLGLLLTGIRRHLNKVNRDLDGVSRHLARVDVRLEQLDGRIVTLLARRPERGP